MAPPIHFKRVINLRIVLKGFFQLQKSYYFSFQKYFSRNSKTIKEGHINVWISIWNANIPLFAYYEYNSV